MEANRVESVFQVHRELRQIQAHCVEALVNAEETRLFTAEFINAMSLLNQNAARLRASITDGQAFVHGTETPNRIMDSISGFEVRLVDE